MTNDTLIQLVTSIVGSGLGLSFLAELFPQWAALPSEHKARYAKLAVLLVSAAAFALAQFAPDKLNTLSEAAKVIGAVVAGYGAQQGYHKLAKSKAA